MAAAIIPHGAANVRRHRVEVADQVLDRFRFQVRLARNRLVHVGDVCCVVFIVVNLHRQRVNVGFERAFGIWKWR